MPKRFTPEVRAKAVRLVRDHVDDYASEWEAIKTVANRFGMTAETLRKWVRQAEIDEGASEGTTATAPSRSHLGSPEQVGPMPDSGEPNLATASLQHPLRRPIKQRAGNCCTIAGMSKRRPTLAQVALHANVSLTTASAAIRGVGRVNPETRDRVLKVARALGYRTNSGASTLRTGANRLVGVVMETHAFDDDPLNTKLFWPRLLNGFTQELTSVGIGVALVSRDDPSPLAGLPIDALAVLSDVAEGLNFALPYGMPVITGGRGLGGEATVSHDYEAIARETLEHLVYNGAKSIALVVPAWPLPAFDLIRDAFIADGAGADIDLQFTKSDEDSIRDALERGVDALVTPGENIAGLLQSVHRSKRGVPGDVLLLSLSETDCGLHIRPSITTMSFCGRKSGTEIARVVVDSISEGKMCTAVLPHELTVRESTSRV